MKRSWRFTPILALPALLAVCLGLGTGTAASAEAATGTTKTIFMKDVDGALKFVGPKSVTAGDELRIVNSTDPKRVGPHTFSLVTGGSLPKTRKARQRCFTPKHICLAIAEWQGAKGQEPPTVNPSKAGAAGWDTEGTVTKKGDSWFTAKKVQSFEQRVTVDASTGPQTIHFICSVHPWMQGSLEVQPAS